MQQQNQPDYGHIPLLSMTFRRIALSTATVAIMFGPTASAFAQTTAEIIESQQEYLNPEFCDDKEGRMRGACISDVINRMKIIREDFKDALEIEREEWRLAHGQLGVSAEYRTALRDYLKSVAELRRAFAKQEREVLRIFFAKQKEARENADDDEDSSSNRFTRRLSTTSIQDAQAECAYERDTTARRVCLRRALRLINPNVRIRGATVDQ